MQSAQGVGRGGAGARAEKFGRTVAVTRLVRRWLLESSPLSPAFSEKVEPRDVDAVDSRGS